jgi:very-short-patch-repair endonuclease
VGGVGKGKALPKNITKLVRALRNNPTQAENYLWYILRLKNLGVKFRRQGVIGKYIVDFVCFEKKLIIEIDGGQHSDNIDDKKRDACLKKQGYNVLRFWNNDVLTSREEVIKNITDNLQFPLLSPPHKGEERLNPAQKENRIVPGGGL